MRSLKIVYQIFKLSYLLNCDIRKYEHREYNNNAYGENLVSI